MNANVKSKYFWLQVGMLIIIAAVFMLTISVGNQAMKSSRQESILGDTNSRIAGVDTVKHIVQAFAEFDRLKASLDRIRSAAQAQIDEMESRNKKGANYFTWHNRYVSRIVYADSVETVEKARLTALRQAEVERLEASGHSRSSLLDANMGLVQKFPGVAFSMFAVILTLLSFIPNMSKSNRRVLLGAAFLAEGVSCVIFNRHFFSFYFINSPITVYFLAGTMTACVIPCYYWSFVGFMTFNAQAVKDKDIENAVEDAKARLQQKPEQAPAKSEFDIPSDPERAIAWLYKLRSSGEYDQMIGKGVPVMQLVALRLSCSRQNIYKRLKALENKSNGRVDYSRLSRTVNR